MSTVSPGLNESAPAEPKFPSFPEDTNIDPPDSLDVAVTVVAVVDLDIDDPDGVWISTPSWWTSSATEAEADVDCGRRPNPDTSATTSSNSGGGGSDASPRPNSGLDIDAAKEIASGPYGIPNLPIASLDAIIFTCSGVKVGRPVALEFGKVNLVREAVCVSGAEMELREIMEGEVRDVRLWDMLGLIE